MKEIRLCDSSEFNDILNLCQNNNLGIEVQSFADLIIKGINESDDIVNERVKNELIKEKLMLADFNGGKSLHGTFIDLDYGAKNDAIIKMCIEQANKSYEVAKELGCTEIVFHNGFGPNGYYESNWTARAIEFWKNFLRDKDDSITICLENQRELYPSTLKNVIDGVNDKRLKACLDIGHAHANSYTDVELWIRELGDRIAYYHLHNNHGMQRIEGYNNDEHLGLNNGTINMERVLSLAEMYSPYAIWNLEAKTKYLVEDIETLKSMGYIRSKKI